MATVTIPTSIISVLIYAKTHHTIEKSHFWSHAIFSGQGGTIGHQKIDHPEFS